MHLELPCCFVQNGLGLVQFWWLPVISPALWKFTMTDTGAIVFTIRNLVPNNWTLPADNPFKQMWCIQMRKGQGTRKLLRLVISTHPQQPLSHFSTRHRRMNALRAGCWRQPCFFCLTGSLRYTTSSSRKTSIRNSSSNCDGLATNVQSKTTDMNVNFMQLPLPVLFAKGKPDI